MIIIHDASQLLWVHTYDWSYANLPCLTDYINTVDWISCNSEIEIILLELISGHVVLY